MKLNKDMVRDFDHMVANLSADTDNAHRVQVVDARPPSLFSGILNILTYSALHASHYPMIFRRRCWTHAQRREFALWNSL